MQLITREPGLYNPEEDPADELPELLVSHHPVDRDEGGAEKAVDPGYGCCRVA